MPSITFTARQVAKEVSKKLAKEVDAKRVRAWVRANIVAFDDDGYTAHAYSASQRTTIINGMTKAAAKPRATAASKGRAKPAQLKTVADAVADAAKPGNTTVEG